MGTALIHVIRNRKARGNVLNYEASKLLRIYFIMFPFRRSGFYLPVPPEEYLDQISFRSTRGAGGNCLKGGKREAGFDTKLTQFAVGFTEDDQAEGDVSHGFRMSTKGDGRSPIG